MKMGRATATANKPDHPPAVPPQSISPAQLWETLTAQQQQKVYQMLVQTCQQLLREARKDEPV